MRSILLHVHDDAGLSARLAAALDLARRFDGHVTCLQPIAFEYAVPGDFYGTAVVELMTVMQEVADRVREATEARLAGEDVRWDWIDERGLDSSRLLEYAALSDVVVIGAVPPPGETRGPSRLAGTLAIHGRTPLLVVPPDQPRLSVGGPALVAWNGSPESSRALRAALPLLGEASEVYLARVAEPGRGDGFDMPPLRGAEYLARHGIECELVELPVLPEGVAHTLEEAARARRAELLVSGAYGHSRMIETIFGGVTRRMLTAPSLPLLLAH